jgi:F0F1-type ATP synthase assembly protein I
MEMGFAVAIGLAIGYHLDKHFVTTKPWLTFIFMFLGIAAAFNSLWRAAREAKKRLDKMERERQPPAS